MSISESILSDSSLKEVYQSSPHKILGDVSFIETQFPVSKMSIESYKERKAANSQTLTSMGRWWGRKPLVLCRATILGLLLPATENPEKDREIFLRLMTMDDDGMLRRKSVNIAASGLFKQLPPADRARYFEPGSNEEKAKLKRGISSVEKGELQKRAFLSLSYDERLEYCDRPEQIDGPSLESWKVINAHLGTNTSSLSELVPELGRRRFGHVPRVGDSFCGGGSIPFEAARLGCEAYGSDLNPVGALLTWAALNVIGGGRKVADEVQKAQREVYDAVDRQITEWGIEHRETDPKTGRNWRADAYLYCNEVTCPECGWRVPLSSSWLIGKATPTVVQLIPDEKAKRFNFAIHEDVSAAQLVLAGNAGTVRESNLVCPNCKGHTPIKSIRGDGRGTFSETKNLLRAWDNQDVASRESDVFRERLYCIRWAEKWIELDKEGHERVCIKRHYLPPNAADLNREEKVSSLLSKRFDEWQRKGFIPNRRIEPGAETTRLARERGWTHWQHLFNPRQLLLLGALNEKISGWEAKPRIVAYLLLGLGRCADYNSRLSRWHPRPQGDISEQVFSNQALNTLFNYATRGFSWMETMFKSDPGGQNVFGRVLVRPADAREITETCDVWITDPPYADAINYHEISDFFLGFYAGNLSRIFSEWTMDARRALAVTGSDEEFTGSMVDCYRNLSAHMPSNGIQIVMFTHQDPGVWADLAMILWAAGLRVTAAWCIATETESALKEGNFVQGTVLLVLRRQTSGETAFLDEVYQEVEAEVRRQLDTMRELDDAKDPNFSDTDYQLAAYAAALRVLTAKNIPEIDVGYELSKTRKKGDKSPVEDLIERAVKIACDHLVPKGIDTHLWKSLTAWERLYIKGLELESHGEYRTGVYQELARGFGVEEYKPLLASTKANETRLKTATEFGRKEMGDNGFGHTLVRHALFSALKTIEAESTRDGITWLTTEVKDYAANRQRLIEILEFLAALRQNASMPHWHKDAEAAGLLAGALRNRQDNV